MLVQTSAGFRCRDQTQDLALLENAQKPIAPARPAVVADPKFVEENVAASSLQRFEKRGSQPRDQAAVSETEADELQTDPPNFMLVEIGTQPSRFRAFVGRGIFLKKQGAAAIAGESGGLFRAFVPGSEMTFDSLRGERRG